MSPPAEWSFAPVVLAAIAVLTAAYLLRRRAVLRSDPSGASRRRLALFAAGVLVLLLALVSPLDKISERYLLSAHMVQTLLLVSVAPVLLLAGSSSAMLAPATSRLAPIMRAMPILGRPELLLVAGLAVVVGWHVPAVHDATLANPPLHDLEHVSFVVAGIVLAVPLGGPLVLPEAMRGMQPIFYLVAAEIGFGVLGIWLAWSPRLVYDFYEAAPRVWGLSPETDQSVAGAILLVVEEPLLLVELVVLVLRMLAQDEEEQGRLEAEFSDRC